MMQELYVDNTILQGILSNFYIKNSMLSVLNCLFFCDYIYVCMIYMYGYRCTLVRAHVLGHAYGRVGSQMTMLWGYLFPQLHGFQRSNSIHQACITNISILWDQPSVTQPSLWTQRLFYCLFLIQPLCYLSWLIFSFSSLIKNTVLDRHAMWIFTFC